MECAGTGISNEEFLSLFYRKTAALRIPFSGSLDLTYSCNLRCVHCYLGKREGLQGLQDEMNTEKVLSVIDEITDAGCLYLLITGGEPLLRRDFPEIYRHAKEKGLLVTIFTNGTLITDRIIGLLQDLPPHVVEISLYGATAGTYEKVTGIPGSYEKCLQGIRKLLDKRIHTKLKTVLMTVNSHEFDAIEGIANDFGVKFRFDAAIFPGLNGDKAPLSLRVAPDYAVGKEFSDHERTKGWLKFFEKSRAILPSEKLYTCGAGLTGFNIDPYGNLQPCLMSTNIRFSLLTGSFMEGWNGPLLKIRKIKADKSFSCTTCEKRHLCGFCPSFFAWENGDESSRSKYLCAMGDYRLQKINQLISQGVNNASS